MFTDWASVPLVCGMRDTCKVLNLSRETIQQRLKDGTMQPAPMPRLGRNHQWSKKTLQQYVDGGYRQYNRRG